MSEERDLSLPPQDLVAEQAVLGSVLKRPRAIHSITDELTPAAFYDPRNGLIFAAMLELARRDVPIDYSTLTSELERLGTYERAGGLLYLSEINLAIPTAIHIDHYAAIVADCHLARRGISELQHGAEELYRHRNPSAEVLEQVQSALLTLGQGPASATTITAESAILTWLDGFDSARPENDKGDRLVGHSTGLRCLDRTTLGLQPARLYLLEAYTSVGKSQLAQQIALHVARHHGAVLMVSLEMSDQELTSRAIAQESGVQVERLATHEIDVAEAAHINEIAERQSRDPLFYMDGSDGLTTGQIRSRAMQLQSIHGRLALVVIDYGQLLRDSKGNNSTVEDQTLVSRNLKRMARALDVPVLVPVQINRARSNLEPQLSDIRESGSWEQDADVVIGMYRDELVNPDTKDKGLLSLSVLKNRHAGEKPPAKFKAVWARGKYWEWTNNSYADRRRTPVAPSASATNGHAAAAQPSWWAQ